MNLLLSPQTGIQKRKVTVFHTKVENHKRKSSTKFLCTKTFSGKVVRHSLAYLTVHKLLLGDVTQPLKMATSNRHLLVVPHP